MLVRTSAFYTPELLRANPEFLFVFGDNLARWGKGGQAAIRDEPNAVGLATKAKPDDTEEAFFRDCEADELAMSEDVLKVLKMAAHRMVVIPFTDAVQLGTGLSELPTRAPKLYEILANTFTADMPRAALRLPVANPIEMVCETCGSEDVVLDAWAEWDTRDQQWDLRDTFDAAFCNDCEGECHIAEKALT